MPNCGKNGRRGDTLVVGQVYDIYSGDEQDAAARAKYIGIVEENQQEWLQFSYYPKQVDGAGNENFIYILYYDPADPVGGPPWPYEAYKYCPVAEYVMDQGAPQGNMQMAPRYGAIGAEDEDMNGGRRKRRRKTRKPKRRGRKTKRTSK